MVAGLNLKLKVWHITADADNDDAVGGAQVTGTATYSYMPGRIRANMPSQLLLQQGLETQRTFTGMLWPGTALVYERDEIEVIGPVTHRYYGQRYRVKGVTECDFHPSDKRTYLLVSLVHSEVAHANQ